MFDPAATEGFDWDDGNVRKSLDKHSVTQAEAEQIFAGEPLLAEDHKHSQAEVRFQALGQTVEGRRLHVTFTLRDGGRRIRIISARDMNRKEKVYYEQEA
jgi:hypothetical protein